MPKKLKMEELNRLSVDEFKHAKKFPIVVILDNIRSLSNIGSVFRTSDAFRIESVYLCGITATPPHSESVDWKYYKTTIEAINLLKDDGYKIISVEQVENSTKLHDLQVDKNCKYALVFGNEVKGVDKEIVANSDCCVEIPQWGTKHSLNISVSVGIVLWDMVLKLK